MVYIFKKYEPSMTILPSCLTMSKRDMLTDFAQPIDGAVLHCVGRIENVITGDY